MVTMGYTKELTIYKLYWSSKFMTNKSLPLSDEKLPDFAGLQ